MNRYQCVKCGESWFTAGMGKECPRCGEVLIYAGPAGTRNTEAKGGKTLVEEVAEYAAGAEVLDGGENDQVICPVLTATQGFMAKCFSEKCALWYTTHCAILDIAESLAIQSVAMQAISDKFTRDF